MLRDGALRLLGGLALTLLLLGCSATGPIPVGYSRATVLIEHAKGHGSGTIVGPDTVLTAYHVVQQGPLDVRFFNGPVRDGNVIWHDEELDLALVEVDVPDGYPAVKFSCGELKAGEYLISVGHPTQSRWVAVGGYLPATYRIGSGGLVPLGFPVGLGTSGGPVFDPSGRIAGVTLAILAERESASAAYDRYKDTGIGLMLPAEDFCDALRRR